MNRIIAAIALLVVPCAAQATFGRGPVTLTVVMDGTGMGAVIGCGPGPWTIGTVESCVALANPGSVFSGWSTNSSIGQWGMRNSNTISGLMAVNVTLRATFTALLPAPTGVSGAVNQAMAQVSKILIALFKPQPIKEEMR